MDPKFIDVNTLKNKRCLTSEDLITNHRSFLMGISMVSIMFFHQNWMHGFFFDFMHQVGHLGVDVFTFLSGWGIYHSLQHNTAKLYYRNRLIRLLPSCLLIGWLQILMDQVGIDGMYDTQAHYLMRTIGMFKWYILALLLYYFLAPYVHSIQSKFKCMHLLLGLSVLISFVFDNISSDTDIYAFVIISFVLQRLPAFLFGMWIAQNPIQLSPFCKLCGLLVYLGTMNYVLSGMINQWWYGSLYVIILFALPFMLYVLVAVSKVVSMINKPISWLGLYTLETYLWHEFVFEAAENCMGQLYHVLLFPVSVFISIVLSYYTKKIVDIFVLHCV